MCAPVCIIIIIITIIIIVEVVVMISDDGAGWLPNADDSFLLPSGIFRDRKTIK